MLQKVTVLDTHRDEQPQEVSRQEFMEILDCIERSLDQVKLTRKKFTKIDEAKNYLNEMRFIGMFNWDFRRQFYRPLEELLDDLYIEIHG